MFAVVRTGGKQYRVAQGDVIAVEKLPGEAGDTVTLNEVLATGGDKPQIGTPLVKDASVSAEIIGQEKADKIFIFKKKRRHTYRRKLGHRQSLTRLRITAVPGATQESAKPKQGAKPKMTKSGDSKAAAKKPAAKGGKKDANAETANKTAPKKQAASKKNNKMDTKDT